MTEHLTTWESILSFALFTLTYIVGALVGKRIAQKRQYGSAVVTRPGEEELCAEEVAAMRILEWRRSVINQVVYILMSQWRLVQCDDLTVDTAEPDTDISTVHISMPRKNTLTTWNICFDWKKEQITIEYYGIISMEDGDKTFSDTRTFKIKNKIIELSAMNEFHIKHASAFEAAQDEDDELCKIEAHSLIDSFSAELVASHTLAEYADQERFQKDDRLLLETLLVESIQEALDGRHSEILKRLITFYHLLYNEGEMDERIEMLAKHIKINEYLGRTERSDAEDDPIKHTTDA